VDVDVLGWRGLEPKPLTAIKTVPPGIRAGTVAQVVEVVIQSKSTKPPTHHTDASLLCAMETAGATLEGELAHALANKGLGTPATRAAIIEALVARRYVVRDGKLLRSTGLGQALIAQVPESVRSPALTGEWEWRLRRVELGEESYGRFMQDVRAYVSDCVDVAREQAALRPGTSVRARWGRDDR